MWVWFSTILSFSSLVHRRQIYIKQKYFSESNLSPLCPSAINSALWLFRLLSCFMTLNQWCREGGWTVLWLFNAVIICWVKGGARNRAWSKPKPLTDMTRQFGEIFYKHSLHKYCLHLKYSNSSSNDVIHSRPIGQVKRFIHFLMDCMIF